MLLVLTHSALAFHLTTSTSEATSVCSRYHRVLTKGCTLCCILPLEHNSWKYALLHGYKKLEE